MPQTSQIDRPSHPLFRLLVLTLGKLRTAVTKKANIWFAKSSWKLIFMSHIFLPHKKDNVYHLCIFSPKKKKKIQHRLLSLNAISQACTHTEIK